MSARHKTFHWLPEIALFLVGVFIIGFGLSDYLENDELGTRGITTAATVVEVRRITTSGGGGRFRPKHRRKTYIPVVRYVDAEGKPQTGSSKVRSIEYASLKKGDVVTITYHPDAPEEVLLQGESGKSGPGVLMVIGALFCLGSCYLICKGNK